MSDPLTLQVQKMEKQYADLKTFFASDGKVTPDELLILKDVQTKIEALRQKAQARTAQVAKEESKAEFKTEGSKKVTTKNGFEAGAVGGLHANVACKIGDPVGDPRRYPVSLIVSFGASAKVSGGASKGEGGSKVSVGVELKGSVERTMVRTHMLSEAEVSDYVAALRVASKGGKAAGKQDEFAVIAIGVNQSWDDARKLYAALSGKGITADSVKNKGDSMELGEKRTSGAGVNLKAGGVGVGVGTTNTQERSTKVTRNDQGTLDVDAKSAYKSETNLSGSVEVGVVGVKVGSSHTRETSFGYSITVDPKKDPDGKILEWLNRCTTPQHYQVFMAANHGKVTVTRQTTGKVSADALSIGVSLFGKEASIGTNQGVKEETVLDGQGRLVKKTVVGTAGAGGKMPGHSDSAQDEAVAEIDGTGEAKVTLTRTTKDGDVVDKSGLGLSNDDLKVIGGIAVRSLDAWKGAIRRADERNDWIAVGVAIKKANGAPAVVAEELARFIGGDRVERMKTFKTWIQNGYKGRAIGRKFEFPEALKRLQESYDVVTAESVPKEMDKLAASNAAAAVEKCKSLLKIIDVLDPQIRNNNDFANNATKMEMLQRLVNRRKLLADAVVGYAGKKPEEDPALLQQAVDRLQKQLSSFSVEQSKVGAKLYEMLDGQPKFLVRELADAKGLIRQLNDIQNRWWTDYRSMKETMSKRGVPNWDMPMLKPDEAMLKRYEKAAGLS